MKFPLSVKDWKICDCEKADWQVIKIEKDDKLVERFRQLPKRTQNAIIKHQKRVGGGMSTYQYILTLRCRGCGFTWTEQVTENMLKKEEKRETEP